MDRYSEQLDDLDASVFSGEILYTNLEEFQKYLNRWQSAIDSHRQHVKPCDCGYDTCAECNWTVTETS